MTKCAAAVVTLWVGLLVPLPTQASSTCVGVLTDAQLRDFEHIFVPPAPFVSDLSEADGGAAASGIVKRMTRKDIEQALRHTTPLLATGRDLYSESEVALIQQMLRADRATDLPAWKSFGMAVPETWLSLTPDDFAHLMDRPGTAGRVNSKALIAANSPRAAIGITRQVAEDASGRLKFLWAYLYQTALHGALMIVPLASCQADVVTVVQNPSASPPDDEQALVTLEQQLARAWTSRDRPTLERVLAPEWAVTTADGAKLFRAAVLAAVFTAAAPPAVAVTTDDLTMTQFGEAAVVRGRTVATVTAGDEPETSTASFTDVCIKREGQWQVVASHQSRVSK
ncbi:MAG: nuclear transport factor 2 family protein [Betaproteobacteria bacterium]